MRRTTGRLLVAAWLASAVASTVSSSDPQFEDRAPGAGVSAPHAALEDFWAVGQAWGDANGDGRPDLYVSDQDGPNTLYSNMGDGTFTVSPYSGELSLPSSPSSGAVFADYDNDGDQDLYVCNRGANALFRNGGASGFVDVTAAAGVGDLGKGSTASWGDYDGDGWLDLYVANWLHDDCPGGTFCLASSDRLYHSLGDGTFEDVTTSLGIENVVGHGFVASFLDYDNDGDLDIYLVNDMYGYPIGNKLWRNDGAPGQACTDSDWCWAEVAAQTGADTVLCGMGLAVGDYDNDGDLDMYFSNAPGCGDGLHVLLQNQTSQGAAVFLDVTAPAGVASDAIGWGTAFFDADNDGWLDLYVAQSGPAGSSGNRFYRNLADGTFADLSAVCGAGDEVPTWGVATADYDADGRVDLVTTNRDAGPGAHRLYRNVTPHDPAATNWLAVHLVGADPINRDAVGARVYLVPAGGASRMQEVKAGSSLGSGNGTVLHFGLGAAISIDSLTVRWPDGKTSIVPSVAVGQLLEIAYGQVFSDDFESGNADGWSTVVN